MGFVKHPFAIALYIWLYLGWFACVLLGKYGFGLPSLMIPALGWALYLKALKPAREAQAKVLLLCVGGMATDAAAAKFGLITFATPDALLPLWLLSLWLLFAPALHVITQLLSTRLWLAAALGALMGPVCYKSGETFGVLTMGPGALAAYAVFWAAFTPAAVFWIGQPQKRKVE
jgi:hypothetical protein